MSTIVNPAVPYKADIPGGLQVGTAITLNGTVQPYCRRFTIDLKCCKDCQHTDIPFHINVRFEGTRAIVRNTFIDSKWLEEERDLALGFPLTSGQIFGLIILNGSNDFKIAINGHHMAEFKHRLPYQCIKAIEINGDLKISQLSFHVMSVPSYPSSGINKSSSVVIPPVYHPALPFTQLFHGGLKLSTIRIFGRPNPSAKVFIINFRTDAYAAAASNPPTDIALHISVRFNEGEVVLNNLTNNKWQHEQRFPNTFYRATNFELTLNIDHHSFQILVNGHFCATYPHRVFPVSRITSMQILEHVVISNIQFK